MEKILSFDQALRNSHEASHRHVFLGNGFSRACRDSIFAYDALFDRADFRHLSKNVRAAFDVLSTTDFEIVMDALRSASRLITVYKPEDMELSAVLCGDADGLKDVLVQAIAGSHPNLLSEIEINSYQACKRFLSHFERIFTLNYDLLLYWAVMQRELEPTIRSDDGFRTPENGEEEYVTWEIENSYNQNIYYLHGALHLFDAGAEIQKFTWANTGIRLTDQIRSALDQGKFPLFVAGGSSMEKLARIKHSAYLTKAFASFSGIGGALFLFGHSLGAKDDHFLKLVEKGRVSQLYVSIHGNQSLESNRVIIQRARQMQQSRMNMNARRRKPLPDLNVYFYDAMSAGVWG